MKTEFKVGDLCMFFGHKCIITDIKANGWIMVKYSPSEEYGLITEVPRANLRKLTKLEKALM